MINTRKIILLSLIGSVILGAGAITTSSVILLNENNSKSNNTPYKVIDHTTDILNDLVSNEHKYNIDVINDFEIRIKETAWKVFSIYLLFGMVPTIWDKNVEYKTDIIKFQTSFDLREMQAIARFENRYIYTFYDPFSLWFGDSVFWIPYDFHIFCNKSISAPLIKIDENWLGDVYQYNFGTKKFFEDKVGYHGVHKYVLYNVNLSAILDVGFYAINTNHYVVKSKLNNLVKLFLEGIAIPNNNLVYNEQTIRKYKQMKFSNLFSILYELNQVKNILDELQNKEVKSDNELQLINDILNYRFYSFSALKKRYEILKKYNFLTEKTTNDNFIVHKNNLDNALMQNNKFINLEMLDYEFYHLFYNVLLTYFKNNDIYVKAKVNNELVQFKIWNKFNFCNIFSQIPHHLQYKTNTINIEPIELISEPNDINYNKYIVFEELRNTIDGNYVIKYRYNAANKFVEILNFKQAEGIILNTNKYLSEITDGSNILNKQWLLQKINNTIFEGEQIFSDVDILSDATWSKYVNQIDIDAFNNFYKLNANYQALNYEYSDAVGVFYAVLTINDLYYEDNTFGDYRSDFVSYVKQKINAKKNNLLEIANINDLGYFVIKFSTNKIII